MIRQACMIDGYTVFLQPISVQHVYLLDDKTPSARDGIKSQLTKTSQWHTTHKQNKHEKKRASSRFRTEARAITSTAKTYIDLSGDCIVEKCAKYPALYTQN